MHIQLKKKNLTQEDNYNRYHLRLYVSARLTCLLTHSKRFVAGGTEKVSRALTSS